MNSPPHTIQPQLFSELTSLHRNPLPVGRLVDLLQLQGDALHTLYQAADAVRREHMGDAIYIRGIIEFSNHCRKQCNYCGIRAGMKVDRYRMSADEIVATATAAREYGCTTVVLQSGEDLTFSCDDLCDIIRRIKSVPNMAVTLSLGERPAGEYERLREAGADRYLMRFETSDPEAFKAMHPDDNLDQRIDHLRRIRSAGIQLGSGFLIALPHGGLELLARDILFAAELKLDMIGCGPFISHPDTPMRGFDLHPDREVYFKTIALLRLLNPLAHIPATTAFDAIFKFGRDRILQRGANVFMPNLTPMKYRENYQLYPHKPCTDEDAAQCAQCTLARALRLGRTLGTDMGHSRLRKYEV